ncbi:MAG: hypothetical protein VXW65_07595 [Pseudomonadota bacterium]|nr:hypothetical protein [Pseudomonadota bacterium]
MCNCSALKEIVVDLDSSWISQAIPYEGKEAFAPYFEEIEAEEFEPELSYSEDYYTCKDCGQAWYFECAPTEGTFPLLGIKLKDEQHRLCSEEIEAHKDFITILAHNGFESSKCRTVNCNNFKLKGKQLCHRHLSLP